MKKWNKKSLISLVTQLAQINGMQKKLAEPLNILICGNGEKTDALLKKREAHKWLMKFEKSDFREVGFFELNKGILAENIIYLSGDSEEEMTHFDET